LLLLHSRSPPLTLGRSLQLVTENFGRFSSVDRRKKTVRFNSEEWGRQAAAAAAAGYAPSPYLAGPSSLLTSYLDSCSLADEEDDSWMSIEDVRSGRWARWEAVRQESQDSQTRDSGIETGSCFTSSEDSNRGGDIYLSKKVSLGSGKRSRLDVERVVEALQLETERGHFDEKSQNLFLFSFCWLEKQNKKKKKTSACAIKLFTALINTGARAVKPFTVVIVAPLQ
jgi:hypothetical protein